MTSRKVLEMTFRTSLGKTRTIRIFNPNPTLSNTHLNNSANVFMSVNPFDATAVGTIQAFLRAEYVDDEVKVLVES